MQNSEIKASYSNIFAWKNQIIRLLENYQHSIWNGQKVREWHKTPAPKYWCWHLREMIFIVCKLLFFIFVLLALDLFLSVIEFNSCEDSSLVSLGTLMVMVDDFSPSIFKEAFM